MNNKVTGHKKLSLSMPDESGSVGYFLLFDFEYDAHDPAGSISYSNIEFSGPGAWDQYSQGDDYPYGDMCEIAIADR